jgi:hypothetical protein
MTTLKEYLLKESIRLNTDAKERAEKENTSPCAVCGETKFIQKFRNVVGKVEGEMHGYFSLFGGSVHGHINGKTSTLPVLSCRNCGNERKIATYNTILTKKIFYRDMYNFYFGIEHNESYRFKDIPKIYLENPKETKQYLIDNVNYDWLGEYEFYNEIKFWDPEKWIKAGFKIEKKIVTKFKFLWWEVKETVYDF